MLFKDGTYEIYYVQHLQDDERWVGSNLQGGSFLDNMKEKDLKEFRELSHDYYANGRCWQTTGLTGAFDPNVALKLMCFVAGFNPERKFRVVKITTSQKTEPYCTVEYNMANWELRDKPEEFG